MYAQTYEDAIEIGAITNRKLQVEEAVADRTGTKNPTGTELLTKADNTWAPTIFIPIALQAVSTRHKIL